MCFAWSVLYDLSLCFLVYHNHPCCTHLLRETHMIWNLLEYSMCFTYIFLSVIIFALVLHLDLLEHGGGFVLKKLLISHASLRLF